MSIDDPISAARDRVEAEERADFGSDLAAKLVDGVLAILPLPPINAIRSALSRDRLERIKYFQEIICAEVTRMRGNIEEQSRTNAEYRTFIERDLPSLLIDAFKRAEQIRTRTKIARLASILVGSLRRQSPPDADDVEDLMEVANHLSDDEVELLEEIRRMTGPLVTGDGSTSRKSLKRWSDANLKGKGVPGVFRMGPKLMMYGLIRETLEYRTSKSPPWPWPYVLLPKGLEFLNFLSMSGQAQVPLS